jgi:hypothetical protein
VVALFLAARRLAGERLPRWLKPAVAYALGSLGALWLVGRTIQCFTASFTGS